MKIYVASSWRNNYQPRVVEALRADGHEVYDFKDSEGFHWTEVDPDWQKWPQDISKYLAGLNNPCAVRGFNRDMDAHLKPCRIPSQLLLNRQFDAMAEYSHILGQRIGLFREEESK